MGNPVRFQERFGRSKSSQHLATVYVGSPEHSPSSLEPRTLSLNQTQKNQRNCKSRPAVPDSARDDAAHAETILLVVLVQVEEAVVAVPPEAGGMLRRHRPEPLRRDLQVCWFFFLIEPFIPRVKRASRRRHSRRGSRGGFGKNLVLRREREREREELAVVSRTQNESRVAPESERERESAVLKRARERESAVFTRGQREYLAS